MFRRIRDILKINQLEDFFRNSCFGHFFDVPNDTTPRFEMTIFYELLKIRFIFINHKKKDEIIINYCGMQSSLAEESLS